MNAVSSIEPTHIVWLPINTIPSVMKDGRRVLVKAARELVARWFYAGWTNGAPFGGRWIDETGRDIDAVTEWSGAAIPEDAAPESDETRRLHRHIAPILTDIEAFLSRHPDMTASSFGAMAIGDASLVSSLRLGRDPSSRIVARIMDCMARHDASGAQAA